MAKASTSFCHLALKNGFQPARFLSKTAAQFLRNRTGNFPAWLPTGSQEFGMEVENQCIQCFFGFFCTMFQAVSLIVNKGWTEQPRSLQEWDLSWQWLPTCCSEFCIVWNSKMLPRIKSWILPAKLYHNFYFCFFRRSAAAFSMGLIPQPVPLGSEVCCSWPALFRMFSPVFFILVLFHILLLWAHVNLFKKQTNKKNRWC